jgi:deazaflavin-dependent oxidoreductase (nitroreductase family)
MQTMSSQGRAVDLYDAEVVEFRERLNRHVVADTAEDVHRDLISEFRASGGQLGGVFAGSPLLLLTTTGRKSGRRHTIPVLYTRDGDQYVVLASKAGAPTNPSWYHNLLAQPRAIVELGDQTFEVVATVVAGTERERLFAQHARQLPIYAEYQHQTTRAIPVLVLQRLSPV